MALSLTFIGLDSAVRLRAIWNVTNVRVDTAPAVREDATTVTGYAGNKHKLIVPAVGMDGYHWMMQAERMVSGDEGWRVRHVDYDHPPNGREVEWNGFLRWEVAALAWAGTHATAIELAPDGWVERTRDVMFGPYRPGGLPIHLAMERVAPWTNTVNLVLLVLVSVPLIARRFGSIPAALLALGFAAVAPFYEFFSVGYFDHHGLAATWDLLMVIFLVAGGAGWLRADSVDRARLSPDEQRVWNWLPARPQARAWFVASAIMGGAGLWESAASTVPAMVGIGIGAVLGTAWLGRGLRADSPWRVDPTLWRTWGRVGGAASLFFYALEYLPNHFGWNLQVNHPLYALAWLGAGDLLCRICEWILRGRLGATPADARRAGLLAGVSLLAVAVLPVTIAFTSAHTFVIADSFLWSLCVDYILEIQSLFQYVARMEPSEILGRMSLIPLLALPVAALLWKTRLAPPARGLLSIAVFPAFVLSMLAVRQSRWLGVGCVLWLGVLLVVAFVCASGRMRHWRMTAAAGVFLTLILVPFPTYAISRWIRFDWSLPVTQVDLTQVVTRDVAYRIRQRLGNDPGVIVSGPSTTTWLTYFGGFKGLGTLYSENLDGLKATASIYSARSADEAFALSRKYGVTHFAIFSWDAFAQEYARLSHGLRAQDPLPEDGFVLRILRTGTIPNWLRPLPYRLVLPSFANQYVRLFEVVPDQTPEEAAVRVAQYLWGKDKPDDALRQLRPLLAQVPDYLPALICVARLQQSRGDLDRLNGTMQQIRANLGKAGALALEDRVDLAGVMVLAGDQAEARAQLTGALQRADERSVRRLLPETLVNMVALMRDLKLTTEYASTYELAVDLLPPEDTTAPRHDVAMLSRDR
jgi:hypothetical protein